MKRNILTVAVISSFLAFSGCATGPTQQDAGMVIGGILGGVLGSQVGHGDGTTAAIIVGTLLGGAIGGAVGRSMDDTDRLKTAHSLENVRTGVPSQWKNPDSGNSYAVVPTKTFETSSGPCREYVIDAVVGGKPEKVYGTACRQSDGSWKTQ
jgi:surface antigen